MKKKPFINFGFSLIELMVVIGISAFLLMAVGLSVYSAQKNNLVLEQVGQELSSEIRLVQSKIIGIQRIEGLTPKAAVIQLQTGSNPVISYIYKNPTCTNMPASTNQTFAVMPRATISSISTGSTVYLVFITPTGQFFALSSPPSFVNGPNNSCRPTGAPILNTTITVTLNNGSRDYYLKVDSNNGAVTPTPNP